VLPAVIERIKERLRTLPKLDVLSMPFRISFVRVGSYRYVMSIFSFNCLRIVVLAHYFFLACSLDVEIVCYFATKSIDEFLTLQQVQQYRIFRYYYEYYCSRLSL